MKRERPPSLCQNCGGEKPRGNRFCGMACAETFRQAHGGKMPRNEAVLIAVLPVELPLEYPPKLTAEEIAEAAVFIMSGQVREITAAIARLQVPDDEEEAS